MAQNEKEEQDVSRRVFFWSVSDIAVIAKMENIGSLKKLKEIMDLCLDMIRKLAYNCIGALRVPCLS